MSKEMIIRGARIVQQMEREGLLDEASNYAELERKTIAGFPYTKKRQHVVTPVQITRTQFVPFAKTGNLRVDAVAKNNGNTYNPQILFNEVEYEQEESNETVTVKASTGEDITVKPIVLNSNTCKVRCTCMDFYFRFAEWNFNDDSLYGDKPPPYQRKTTTRPDANPTKTPGICKHVMKTILSLRNAGLIRR